MSNIEIDLDNVILDPSLAQGVIYDQISSNSDYTMVDPTSPLAMLMEASMVAHSNSIKAISSDIRKLHPTLATNRSELLHHISDNELTNMFAIPSEGVLVFYLNVMELRQYGHRKENSNYVETIIPINTEVEVSDTTFTLLNEISIKLYDNGTTYVEQKVNNDIDIAVNDLGVLSSGLVTDNNGVSWLIFESKLKQLKRYVYTDTIITATGFSKEYATEGEYYFSNLSINNSVTNGEYVHLNKTHSDDYIDASTPTVYIEPRENKTFFKIPEVYIIGNIVSGNVMAEIYSTKGEIQLPLNKFAPDDFHIYLGDTGTSSATATSQNISMTVSSRMVLSGGKNASTVEEIKTSIIEHTTGDIDLPITENALKRKSSFYGFDLYPILDMLTNRSFVAAKYLTDFNSSLLYANADIFFNTTELIINEIRDSDFVFTNDEELVIKSNTIFRENNGKVSLIGNGEKNTLENITNVDKVNYLNDQRLFFTPFYYVIDKNNEVIETRVYDLDRPSLDKSRILTKNNNVSASVNVDNFGISRTATGYKIRMALKTNGDFDSINPNYVKTQLQIPLKGEKEIVTFYGEYDVDSKIIEFNISTDSYVDTDNYIKITDGSSLLQSKFLSLISEAKLYIYASEPSIIDSERYMFSELVLDNNVNNNNIVVFTKENIEITLGKHIEYIWNKTINTFNSRKYRRYEENIPLTYSEDVYEKDLETGSIVLCDGDEPTFNILHNKGDAVLDDNGDPVYKHTVGELILDENNLPIIDEEQGVIRYVDIFMLEYEYLASDSTVYKNYLNMLLDTVDRWLTVDLVELNNLSLENTEILFKSYKKSNPVSLVLNDSAVRMDYKISPKITIYGVRNNYSVEETFTIKNKVGAILHNHFNNIDIKLSNIKEDIINTLGGDVSGVHIEIGTDTNLEIIKVKDVLNRITIDKKLDINSNNEAIVVYDLDIEYIKI